MGGAHCRFLFILYVMQFNKYDKMINSIHLNSSIALKLL